MSVNHSTEAVIPALTTQETPERKVKCVVWDLDHTIWDGVLLEDKEVTLKPGVKEVIETLDRRGILHSVASRNEPKLAMAKLRELGLAEYFLYPQIGWNPKSASIREVVKSLNLGSDSLAFVDDQPFELAEVAFAMPEVLCLDAGESASLPERREFQPLFITEDSQNRRRMYLSDLERQTAETQFSGIQDDFLATLQMRFHINRATESDLQRAEELTVRTHQLNTTGYTYSYEELKGFSESAEHWLLIASLEDRFGTYGKIGLALVEIQADQWKIKLLLMSCRVISRGVGTVLLNFIMREARQRQVRLLAEMVKNDRNRMMQVTYSFAGFKAIGTHGPAHLLEANLQNLQEIPPYVHLTTRI